MKDSSKELLLAEHERCRELEKIGFDGYERGLQFYIAVITLSIGALVFLLEGKVPSAPFIPSIVLLLAFVLFVGEITFLRLIGIDVAMTENARRYMLIREKFIAQDPQLSKAFLVGLVANEQKYAEWASLRRIIRRAFSVAQQKTTVVLLNCIIAANIAFALLLPTTFWSYLVIALVVLVMAFLHALYASWRYKAALKKLSSNETQQFWA